MKHAYWQIFNLAAGLLVIFVGSQEKVDATCTEGKRDTMLNLYARPRPCGISQNAIRLRDWLNLL